MTKTLALVAALALIAVPAVGRADVVTTKDGIVLEGAATKAADGSVTVSTDGGDVTLPASAVKSVVEGEGPRAAAKRAMATLSKVDAQGHFKLALSLEEQGLADLAKSEYEAVIAADSGHAAARRALGYEKVGVEWLTEAEARKKGGLVLYQGKWLLPSEVTALAKGKRSVTLKSTDLLSAMKTAATAGGALAKAAAVKIAQAGTAERVDAATGLLVHHDARVRHWACGELKSLGDQSSLRALVAVAARDPEAEVRRAAILAAQSFGQEDLAVPFVRALGSDHPSIVANSAQALAMLGDPRAIRYLVTRVVTHGGSPRSYFLQETMTSYIQDFDVEVAQTSFIADPIIGIIQEGVIGDVNVLDASIERTFVERILLDSFNSLANTQFQSANQVSAWFKENGPALPTFAMRLPPSHDGDAPAPAAPAAPTTTPATPVVKDAPAPR